MSSHRKSTRPSLRMLLGALVGLLLLAGGLAAQAATSPSLASPTLTEAPVNPTASNTATFRFTGPKNAKFECSFGNASYSKCSSPMVYRGLAKSSYTFRVLSVVGSSRSAPTTHTWYVDATPPNLSDKPDDPTYNATNFFSFGGSHSGFTYECSEDNGPFVRCWSPHKWVIPTGNYGQRQFAVRAKDVVGNVTAATTYSFKYQKKLPTEGLPFEITGTVGPLVIGVWTPVELTVLNPNSVTLFVNHLDVAVTNDPPGCTPAQNLVLEQADVSKDKLLAVPAGERVTLPAQGVRAPRIQLVNLPTVNQDACKGVTFDLKFTGTGTN